MKTLLSLAALFIVFGSQLSAQGIYTVDSTYIKFFSEAPLENIEAENHSSRALVNTANKQVAFIIPITSFEFDKELMKEHFNENYMESHKYKSGSFKGSIVSDVDWKKPGTYAATVKGKLNIHGVEQERELKGTIIVGKKGFRITSKFQVKLEDHDIEIPTIVFQNIAEVIDVSVDFRFVPKK